MKTENEKKFDNLWLNQLKNLWFGPGLLLTLLCFLHIFFNSDLFSKVELSTPYAKLVELEPYLYGIGLTIGSYWLFSRLLSKFLFFLGNTSLFIKHPIWQVLLPFFASVLRTLFCLIVLTNVTQRFNGPQAYLLERLLSVLIISAIAWTFIKLIDVISQLLINQYGGKARGAILNRKIYTQILIIKRVALSVVFILSIGSVLMLFDNVRALGASVLTTAGIAGLILTFTAQRSLASLFAGLEIALSQPIKIGDAVVVENKFGTVEEINFRNVVVKLWDWRRLIVPTNYFLEKPFENWSRDVHNHLIGVVTLSVDFTLPVAKVREEMNRLLSVSNFWDKKIGSLEVSDLKERVMELKILASAADPGNAANLQSELREHLIQFIATTYPECLPVTRSLSTKNPSN